MGIGRFFKLPQYNVFDYKPRFYNPEEEARKQQLNKLRENLGKAPIEELHNDAKPGSTIKGSFKPKMSRTSFSKRSSVTRIFIFTAILFFAAYIILMVDLSPLINFLLDNAR